jgi:hypothetical protein
VLEERLFITAAMEAEVNTPSSDLEFIPHPPYPYISAQQSKLSSLKFWTSHTSSLQLHEVYFEQMNEQSFDVATKELAQKLEISRS